jgi:hypothetical protein
VAPSITSTPIHVTTIQPQPPADSDEGRVATCIMVGATPTVSRSASSSSDSSGSKSIMASPPPVPDMVIYVVLLVISEVSEAKLTPQDDAAEMVPHTETSTGEIFFFQI